MLPLQSGSSGDPSPGMIVFALVVVTVAGVIWYIYNKKRREAFQKQAAALGLEYVAKGGEPMNVDWRSLDAMNDGRGPKWRNTIRGTYKGHTVYCTDFQYYTESTGQKGKRQRSYHNRSVSLIVLNQNFPEVRAVPESFGHKIWDAMGGDDIDFESDAFSRKFWVKAKDRKFAYDIFHPRAMELVMTPGWDRWELRGPAIVLWREGTLKPQEVPIALDRIVAFANLIPSFRKAPPPAAPLATVPAPRTPPPARR